MTAPTVQQLLRLTTEYDAGQDRLRLLGEGASGPGVQLWLTQRLMNPLASHLCAWLQRQDTGSAAQAPGVPARTSADAMHQHWQQSVQQSAAHRALAPGADVVPRPGQDSWLVTSVDVNCHPAHGATLVFKGVAQAPAAHGAQQSIAQITLAPQALRQWLGIVVQRYRQGQWSTAAWPEWMLGASLGSPVPAGQLH